MAILSKENLLIGNTKSAVAICCLWARKEVYKNVDKSLYCFVGNLYSLEGINIMLRNILANPTIRKILVTGNDLSKTGEALLAFFKKGIDKDRKIKGTDFTIQENIPVEDLEAIRTHVEIFDMIKQPMPAIREKLESLKENGKPFMKPKVYASIKVEEETLEGEKSGFLVRDKTIAEAWLKMLDLIMKFGVVKDTAYQTKQKELLNVVSVMEAEDDKIAEWLPFTQKELDDYLPSILTSKKPAAISYTYGSRLFKIEDRFHTDQVSHVVEELKKKPYTRRGVVFAWRVEEDMKSDQPPCLTQITWNIQHKKLYQTLVFRSHDIFGGFPMNLFALRKFQERTAKKIGIPCGSLTCISNSAHIYENNWKEVKTILNNYYVHNTRAPAIIIDPRGSVVISIEDGEIIAQHYTLSHKKTAYFFKGKNPKAVFHHILEAHLVSRLDHAAYIGSELQKAYHCLKTGKKYVQDQDIK